MRAFAIGLILAAAPLAGHAAGCQEEFAAFAAFLVEADAIETAPAAVVRSRSDDTCVIEGLRVANGNRAGWRVDRLEWRGTGMARFVDQRLPPTALDFRAENLRLTNETGFQELDEAIAAGSNGLTLAIAADWSQIARSIDLRRFDLEFDEDDGFSLSALVDNVDLSTRATAEMSAGSWAIRDGILTLRIGDIMSGFIERHGIRNEAALHALLARFPETTLPARSREAVVAVLYGDRQGTLRIGVEADPGLGPARFVPVFMGGRSPFDPPVWDGVRFDIGFEPR